MTWDVPIATSLLDALRIRNSKRKGNLTNRFLSLTINSQIADIRADVQHKFTTELAQTAGTIGIEDLHILGMMANRKLARAVADAAMGQLLTFLKNKVANAGGQIFQASRWFPSTKRCSCCRQIKKRMPLKHRTYQCLGCGLVIDRDLNASLNLAQFAHERLCHLPA